MSIIVRNAPELPYVFQEYPKWVTLADKSQIIVENAEEEQAAIGIEDGDVDLSALKVEELKLRADTIGVEYAANVKKDKLIADIEAKEADTNSHDDFA